MSSIKVFSSLEYVKEDSNSFSHIFLVFDDKTFISQERIAALLCPSNPEDVHIVLSIVNKLNAGSDSASAAETNIFCGANKVLTKVVMVLLPTACSRHNSPSRCHALSAAVKDKKSSDNTLFFLFPLEDDRAFAQACAIGRQFPLFSLKSTETPSTQVVHIVVDFIDKSSTAAEEVPLTASAAIENIRNTQRLVDMPPNMLRVDSYVEECRVVAARLGCEITVVQGKELQARGFGGLWGVGQASEHLPALVILSYYPDPSQKDSESVCLVGKGIVYDTGGLSIKTPTTSMAGMKMDMAGSAAVLGAFATAVSVNAVKSMPLHALLCIAENSVGPLSTRPDDIHTLLSGKTVEVNNTDAEGRLVLSDGVFYASKFLNAKVIIDIATLTGAQLIATGKKHAAIYCSDESLENMAVLAGKVSGDLTFPIPYCPEFYRAEFKSAVADMKNSVADRGNAQSSCAGQFIGNHLEDFLKSGGQWLHVDMAGPAMAGERATGYGVGLLYMITSWLNFVRA